MGQYVDSQQLRFSQSYTSCGVMEVHHFPNHTPPKLLFAIANSLYHKANPRPAAFVMWSDIVDRQAPSRGQRLFEYLKGGHEDYKWGFVTGTGVKINPKTGNPISVWIFEVNHEGFRKWYQEELANRIDTE